MCIVGNFYPRRPEGSSEARARREWEGRNFKGLKNFRARPYMDAKILCVCQGVCVSVCL